MYANDAEVLEINLAHLVTTKKLQRASQEDATLQRVRNCITKGWQRSTHLNPYSHLRTEFTSFHQHCVTRRFCVVIPESLQAQVLQMAHDGLPEVIITDNGPQLTSFHLTNFCSTNWHQASPYRPVQPSE